MPRERCTLPRDARNTAATAIPPKNLRVSRFAEQPRRSKRDHQAKKLQYRRARMPSRKMVPIPTSEKEPFRNARVVAPAPPDEQLEGAVRGLPKTALPKTECRVKFLGPRWSSLPMNSTRSATRRPKFCVSEKICLGTRPQRRSRECGAETITSGKECSATFRLRSESRRIIRCDRSERWWM